MSNKGGPKDKKDRKSVKGGKEEQKEDRNSVEG